MFRAFFQCRRVGVAPPSLPEGMTVYAIGDVHGRLDLLERLLAQIREDAMQRGMADPTLIFLGDLIDRGPQSAQVVERVCALVATDARTRVLLGNHEEVFRLTLAGDAAAIRTFHRIGGRETALSYGVDPDALDDTTLVERLNTAVPAAHRALLDDAAEIIILGDYAFVHAGVRPGIAFDAQRGADLRWIRAPFLNHGRALEKIVVHGHTIGAAAEFLPHRIGIDTGAYRTGRLTALGLHGQQRWLVQT